ncbi:DUF3017 domain-containing protein [Streptomyces sp. NPDC097619]|uniref:DUF3017 domain-containing protein n=1 Tax=Streptomyces sp. NPDC097619 TaxID=3157228 RepID=UPI00332EB37F
MPAEREGGAVLGGAPEERGPKTAPEAVPEAGPATGEEAGPEPEAAPEAADGTDGTHGTPVTTSGAERTEGTERAEGTDPDPLRPGHRATPAADAGTPPRRASRRFPSITRDTARPEGGGRAAPGDAPAPARQWPMLVVLGATAAGLLVTAFDQARIGCLIIGAALIAASVMRRVLPSVGMLAVRSRFTDMVTYGLLGVAITLLSLIVEPRLDLPFLEDAVRFAVR